MDTSKIYSDLLGILTSKMVLLPDKPEETPQNTLEALWFFSCGQPMSIGSMDGASLPDLSEKTYQQLKGLIEQRIQGVPLAHLIGKKEFMGVDFWVDASALIPRKETEILGFAALQKIMEAAKHIPVVNVIDVCTGMGNLALAFATHVKNCHVGAADISDKAIELAKKNARNLLLTDRTQFYAGDLLTPFQKEEYFNTIDVLTCNPPYISSGKLQKMPHEIIDFEPEEAFNGGPFGLNIILRLIKEAVPLLKDKGWLCFEVGLGQGEGIIRIMERNKNYKQIESARDEDGNVRAILARVDKS